MKSAGRTDSLTDLQTDLTRVYTLLIARLLNFQRQTLDVVGHLAEYTREHITDPLGQHHFPKDHMCRHTVSVPLFYSTHAVWLIPSLVLLMIFSNCTLTEKTSPTHYKTGLLFVYFSIPSHIMVLYHSTCIFNLHCMCSVLLLSTSQFPCTALSVMCIHLLYPIQFVSLPPLPYPHNLETILLSIIEWDFCTSLVCFEIIYGKYVCIHCDLL